MTTGRILAALLLLAGCSTSEERAKIRLMDQIEETVRLPPGARRLDGYSRYYANQSGGEVAVLYVIHSPEFLQWVQSSCRREPTDTFPCTVSGESRLVQAGGRLWLSDSRDLPSMDGGGCANIEFTYGPAAKSQPRCNGPY